MSLTGDTRQDYHKYNTGGTASAPVLAAAYSGNLVSVGVLMALMGYVVGTFGGIGVGYIMSMFG